VGSRKAIARGGGFFDARQKVASCKMEKTYIRDMFSDQQKREIFEEARNYLLESYKSYGITKEILDDQIAFPEQEKPKTKNKLFYKMIDHAQNRQGMPNAIGDINKLAPYLENFDADAVLKKYRDWEILFDTLKREYHDAPGRMEKGNPHNYWVIYCKSIISIANSEGGDIRIPIRLGVRFCEGKHMAGVRETRRSHQGDIYWHWHVGGGLLGLPSV
jgi:hypothetical protein